MRQRVLALRSTLAHRERILCAPDLGAIERRRCDGPVGTGGQARHLEPASSVLAALPVNGGDGLSRLRIQYLQRELRSRCRAVVALSGLHLEDRRLSGLDLALLAVDPQ